MLVTSLSFSKRAAPAGFYPAGAGLFRPFVLTIRSYLNIANFWTLVWTMSP